MLAKQFCFNNIFIADPRPTRTGVVFSPYAKLTLSQFCFICPFKKYLLTTDYVLTLGIKEKLTFRLVVSQKCY